MDEILNAASGAFKRRRPRVRGCRLNAGSGTFKTETTMRLFPFLVTLALSWATAPARAADVPPGCDSCAIRVDSPDQPNRPGVEGFLARAGGRVDVRLLGPRTAAGHRPFEFVIAPPASFAVAA